MPYRVFDFHTHTMYSDGDMTPVELIRRAAVRGYGGIGIADHVGAGNLAEVIAGVSRDCELARKYWDIIALPGVELTHVPAASIAELAREAKRLGAALVVVHGESIVEPVEPGTNRAAAECPDVDVLAHPGLITAEEMAAAIRNGVFVEVSARKGHCLGNGNVVQLARKLGARLVIDSDAHTGSDLMTPEFARNVALGAGMTEEEARRALEANPAAVVERALARLNSR